MTTALVVGNGEWVFWWVTGGAKERAIRKDGEKEQLAGIEKLSVEESLHRPQTTGNRRSASWRAVAEKKGFFPVASGGQEVGRRQPAGKKLSLPKTGVAGARRLCCTQPKKLSTPTVKPPSAAKGEAAPALEGSAERGLQ